MKQLLGSCCALCIAVNTGSASGQSFLTDTDAYRVYASIVQQLGESAPDRTPLVIRADMRRRAQMSCLPTGRPIENEWKVVMDDFLRTSASASQLDPRQLAVHLAVPFEIASWAEIKSGEDTYDGWRNFSARWPKAGGYYDVSAVGFDPARGRALVYIGHHPGVTGGQGQYHFLEKAGDWREITVGDANVCRGPAFY